MRPSPLEISVRNVDNHSETSTVQFLRRHEDYTLFLLNNFENYGSKITHAPYSGNFKLIYSRDEIVGVFCLARKGSLLIHTTIKELAIFQSVVTACQDEGIDLKGLSGDWNFCAPFWRYLKEKRIIQKEISTSKEVLYRVDLLQGSYSPPPNVRFLSEEDYVQWKPLRLNFLKEKNLPNLLNDEEMWEAFQEKTRKKTAWGLFLKEKLVSVADLTAKAFGIGQLGNVYTIPEMRQKGYSRAVLKQILFDLKNLHKMHKLIIFTDENCLAPQKLYESLGAERIGYYALFFGNS